MLERVNGTTAPSTMDSIPRLDLSDIVSFCESDSLSE